MRDDSPIVEDLPTQAPPRSQLSVGVAGGQAESPLSPWRHIRRIAILIAGSTVLLIGVILIFIPGPAIVVIPAGIAILATEFPWARRLARKFKRYFLRARRAIRDRFK